MMTFPEGRRDRQIELQCASAQPAEQLASMNSIPYDIFEAMIQCFGKAFHYRDAMTSFLLTAGVPQPLADKYRNDPKFVWARKLLTELGQTDTGCLIQRKILTALCKLRNVPDLKVADRDAALTALRYLKSLAVEHSLIIEVENTETNDRKVRVEDRRRVLVERAAKLEKLRNQFNSSFISEDRQRAGYSLQDLLCDVFNLFEIEYRKSFRNLSNTQEIDGHFCFQSFDYLVEAKWRKDQPTEGEIGAFKHKVESKLHGTRGLFVSIAGFRQEVARQFDERGSSIILMDGGDLIHVLEGRVDLRDGLRTKIGFFVDFCG